MLVHGDYRIDNLLFGAGPQAANQGLGEVDEDVELVDVLEAEYRLLG